MHYRNILCHGVPIRTDTRVYLKPGFRPTPTGTCAAVVWMCNPGTRLKILHRRGTWIHGTPDRTIRNVHSALTQAFALKYPVAHPYTDPYIAVLNLFYTYGSSISSSWRRWMGSGSTYFERIPNGTKVVWLGWGGVSVLSHLRGYSFSRVQNELHRTGLNCVYTLAHRGVSAIHHIGPTTLSSPPYYGHPAFWPPAQVTSLATTLSVDL